MLYLKNSMQYFFLLFFLPLYPLVGDAVPAFIENKPKPSILIIYGPPGSSRTKIALKLSHHFNIPKISFAELLAESLHEESQAGDRAREYMRHGGDVPADLFWMIIDNRMKTKDCRLGCIWEGIPWTLEQTKMIKEKFSKQFNFSVFSIHTTSSWLIHRFQGRLFCSSCGRVYNEPHSKPKISGKCDICEHPLKRRHEDSPDFIQSRHTSYEKKLVSVLDFWKKQHLLKTITGDAHLETIYSDISKTIETSFQEEGHIIQVAK
ncbi:MAG: nucleoside monophosphate kinase [Chlamydia sp.]